MQAKIHQHMAEVGDDRSLSSKPRLLKDHPLPPAIKLYYPNGGESFDPGQTVKIRWIHLWQGVKTVHLEYHDGSNWETITDSAPHTGSYTWQIPSKPSPNIHLRARSTDGSIFDESDHSFSMAPNH